MTAAGEASRERLFTTALRLISRRGFEAVTLREVARQARVSPGLLYRYFPSKRAVVLALYERLSHAFAERAATLPEAPWRERFLVALEASLKTLGPHREALRALVPVLVMDGEEGLFSSGTRGFQQRVEAVFVQAVTGAPDAPREAEALGRVLYTAHLAVILFWLLDRSPKQRATSGLVEQLRHLLPLASLALKVPGMYARVRGFEALIASGLLGR